MTYSVKEMFLTLQGEGVHAGRRAVFVRFAGCNLWTGREVDRDSAVCRFCDTDFVGTDGIGGGKFADAALLAAAVAGHWGPEPTRRFVVLTGGEPMLQIDDPLVDALHAEGFEIAIESNGTIAAHPGIDWVCISPKAGSDVVQRQGDELKLVFPQADARPETFADLPFRHRFLQPMDGPDAAANTQAAIAYCRADARWRLSLQTHKIIGIP